jgi:4-alpha-glucanotransferase
VADIKLAALKELWHIWRKNEAQRVDLPAGAFEQFKSEGADALYGHCLFETLSREMTRAGHGSGWIDWPPEFQDWLGAPVRQFAVDHRDDVEFQMWLQWLAAVQLEDVASQASLLGMRVGLYLDFAVGEVPDGSSTWSSPRMVLPGLHIGAPPDAFSARGQDWGLVPLSPQALLDRSASHYENLLGQTARFAGALRLDHAMSLWQLFLIPEDSTPSAGGYLRYPFSVLITDLARISRYHEMLVIGEDLGNVPVGFRPAMRSAAVFSYKVLYFEDVAPEDFDPTAAQDLSLACLSTHDLPPLVGWWSADDIAFAQTLGLVAPAEGQVLRAERLARKTSLMRAAAAAGLIDALLIPSLIEDTVSARSAVAIHRLLARTNSMLVTVRLADMLGERRPTNVPGTQDEHRNWRLKSRVVLEHLEHETLFNDIAEAQRLERPRVG